MKARIFKLVSLLATTLLALGPQALAQDQVQAASIAFISGLAAGPMTIAPGTEMDMPFDVTVRLYNFTCPQEAGTLSVRLEVIDQGGAMTGISGTIQPSNTISFTIPAQAAEPNSFWEPEEPQGRLLRVNVTHQPPEGHEHEFQVRATPGDSLGSNCYVLTSNQKFNPIVSGTANHKIQVGPHPPGTGPNDTSGTTSNGQNNTAEAGGDSPGIGAPLVMAFVAATVFALRRRRL